MIEHKKFDLGNGFYHTMIPDEIQLNEHDYIEIEPTRQELELQKRLMYYEKWILENEKSAPRETMVVFKQTRVKLKLKILQGFLSHYEKQMSQATYKQVQSVIVLLNDMLYNGKYLQDGSLPKTSEVEVRQSTPSNDKPGEAPAKSETPNSWRISRKWKTRIIWYLLGLPIVVLLLGYFDANSNGEMTAVLLGNQKLLSGFMVGVIAGSATFAYHFVNIMINALASKMSYFEHLVQLKNGELGSQLKYVFAHPLSLFGLLCYFVSYVISLIVCVLVLWFAYGSFVLLIRLASRLF